MSERGGMGLPRLPRTVGLVSTLIVAVMLARRWFAASPIADSAERVLPGGDGEQTAKTNDPGRAVAEWTSLGISSVILLALIGTLTYLQFTSGEQPAVIEARPRLEALRRDGGVFYLPVEISNTGGATAQDVRVVISVPTDQGQPESAELMIDFLARGATQQGTAVFHSDPRLRPLQVDVISYLDP